MRRSDREMAKHISQKTRRLTRRELWRTAAGLFAFAATPGALLAPSKVRAAGKLYFATYGGSYGDALDQAFFKPFAKEAGLEVVMTPAITLGKLKAAAMTGDMEWDVIDWLAADVRTASNAGLLYPIDYSVVNSKDALYPDSQRRDFLSVMSYTGGVAYNQKRHPDGKHPESWVEFWDVGKFPGRRGLLARPQATLQIALLADGVAPKSIYPLDVERAFRSLAKIKPHITKWVDPPAQAIELLQKGELDFANTYSLRVHAANKAGFQLGLSKKQLMVFFPPLCVPKGTKNREAAMKLLNFMTRADRQLALAEMIGAIPMNKNAIGSLPEAVKQWLPDTNDPPLAVDDEWWGEPGRLESLVARFKEFMLT